LVQSLPLCAEKRLSLLHESEGIALLEKHPSIVMKAWRLSWCCAAVLCGNTWFPGKLRSKWEGAFELEEAYPSSSAMKLKRPTSTQIVKGQRIKNYRAEEVNTVGIIHVSTAKEVIQTRNERQETPLEFLLVFPDSSRFFAFILVPFLVLTFSRAV
jgi:hypothetical protein